VTCWWVSDKQLPKPTRFARRFRVHDEALLDKQRAVRHDEEQLIATARQARDELERLFEQDRAAVNQEEQHMTASSVLPAVSVRFLQRRAGCAMLRNSARRLPPWEIATIKDIPLYDATSRGPTRIFRLRSQHLRIASPPPMVCCW